MANLKEVRVRIASIKSTRQITSAMKMVSASKLRKGQNAIQNLRPYEEQLRQILDNINKGLKQEDKNVLCLPKPAKQVLVILVAGNKGLCGTFNTNLAKKTVIHLRELKEQNYEPRLWIIGRKAEEFFKKSTYIIDECFHDLIDTVTVDDAFAFARRAMEVIEKGVYQKVDIVYTQFINAATYKLFAEQILPMALDASPYSEPETVNKDDFEYIIEPSRKEILDELVPKVIQTYFYRILLDSFTSEQGARMTAMHKATDNATELLKNLTITYNKVRQASITNEIVEIVGGAEALNS
ncbi:MAG: ATP synthase F1 subunit gamma [Bacteroidetes bacterium]|nr:MAG: ATP synthase F1 subunit gamma [Bacteroidota bacterium]